ncbi:MAG: hypothetical protein KKC79_09825 [Gammaproteobacteria bacterium]|nr:hypothetical protein [Gammaproteobacteria bacterium]MBU1440739.1 hypothetical protein [Gammaproteobacteria bacterium]MBU2408930.1 hypothetical protein [Gammaproteobacteria bacterium]
MHRQLAALRADVVAARDRLIEALGDHLCGSGAGPAPLALQKFKTARIAEADAKARLRRYLFVQSLKVIERARHREPLSGTNSSDPSESREA